ncbi:sensor histidine kinase [Oceanobacillus sp. CAU 1775]
MHQWYQLFPKNPYLSIFAWIAFCLLPFYFVFRFSSLVEVFIGIALIILFFTAYRLSFIKKGWTVYVSVGIEMAISIGMTVFYGYIYFSLFLAFFIGNIKHKVGFFTVYIVHLITTIVAITIFFFTQNEIFITQFPFIIITIIGVILLPFNMYNRNRHEKLEHQLDDANEIISQLIVVEERQRIARDLHDTLGQKLSLIGLKSDLAKRLVPIKPDEAIVEIEDVQQTARTALKEVRELVSNMKGLRLEEESILVTQLMEAAEIEYQFEGDTKLKDIPLYIEHILSMCLKEAVTNVVKHSKATMCNIRIQQFPDRWRIEVEDDGIGLNNNLSINNSNGLQGMRERLEFVNGSLELKKRDGTTVIIQVPKITGRPEQEGLS